MSTMARQIPYSRRGPLASTPTEAQHAAPALTATLLLNHGVCTLMSTTLHELPSRTGRLQHRMDARLLRQQPGQLDATLS